MNKISVTILTKNSCKYLEEVLTALKMFDEVLIYDTGSTDKTMELAAQFPNVTIYQGLLNGFGPTHNTASGLAKNDWVLSIDSDEIVTEEMAQWVLESPLQRGCVYSFPRDNYFNGKHIKWCGWHPDRQLRLYHRQDTAFSDAQVHESILLKNVKEVPVQYPFIHYSYDTISDFLAKMQSYSDLFARQNHGKKTSSMFKAVSHALFTFFKCYFIKRGFLGGKEGFIISEYNAHTAFYKYLKLAEINQRHPKPVVEDADALTKKQAETSSS